MRKIFFFLAVLVIAVSAVFIVKANKKAAPNVIAYYIYTSDPYDAAERINPLNYILSTSSPEAPCQNGANIICGVYCNGNGTNPYIISGSTLETRLGNNSSYSGVIFYEDASLMKQ